jgi:hypothetical protein
MVAVIFLLIGLFKGAEKLVDKIPISMNLSYLCLEVGVSYYLHRRSFCVEEGGLLLLDEFIGSLPDGFRKQHRHHTDGAVQIRFGCPEEHFLTPKHENTLLSLPDRLVRL